jgi:hypothetical protein
MKNINVLKVQGLRLYANPVEVESAVSKTKSLRYGALILGEMLPKSAGQDEANAVQLSLKQLDNLCAGCGIPTTGKPAWNILQGYLLRGGHAYVSSEEHKEGDTYVDTATGEERKYTRMSTNCNVDSIILPMNVVDKLQQGYIDKVINWRDTVDDLKDVLNVVENEVKVN